jgi:hypothetical protein
VAGTLILACSPYLVWGPAGAVMVVVLISCSLSLLQYRLVRKIESMDGKSFHSESRTA